MRKNLYNCLERGFEAAKYFTDNSSNDGYRSLFLLFGSKERTGKIVDGLDGIIVKEYEDISEGILYSPYFPGLLDKMGTKVKVGRKSIKEIDGAIALNLNGDLIGTELYVQSPLLRSARLKKIMSDTLNEVKIIKGGNGKGTKHRAAVYASLREVPSIVVSEEKGTVITFKDGKIIRDLVYDPERELYT